MTAVEQASAGRVASRALRWLRAHQEQGVMPADGSVDLEDPSNAYKPLSESGLAAFVVLREAVADEADLVAARDVVDFAWHQLGEGDLLYERALRQTLLADPLEVYMHFARCGRRHPRLEEVLAHKTRLRSTRAIELLPNRKLSVANAEQSVGLDHDHDWAALARATWLGALPEPWVLDWDTAYHMTHAVFHLTDWGARPTGLGPEITSYLHTWLPVWIEIWLEVGQWDLVGELLVVGACLDEPYLDAEHWDAFATAQHDDGLMPRDTDPVDRNADTVYANHQHTTIVAILAGTLAVRRTASPTPKP